MIDKSIIEKINKLLALANSSNENEAAVAAQKASLLLTQYNLSLADLGSDDLTDITELVVETTTRFISWKMLLLGGIAEANGCQAFRNNYNGNMRLIGSYASLIVCQNMYEYLSKTIEQRAKYRQGRGRAYLNAFRVGCATRLSQRLAEQRSEIENNGIAGNSETPQTPAIVVRSMFEKSEAAVAEYLKRQGFKIKTKSAQLSSESGFNSGYKAGDQISLNKQIPRSDHMKRLPNALR